VSGAGGVEGGAGADGGEAAAAAAAWRAAAGGGGGACVWLREGMRFVTGANASWRRWEEEGDGVSFCRFLLLVCKARASAVRYTLGGLLLASSRRQWRRRLWRRRLWRRRRERDERRRGEAARSEERRAQACDAEGRRCLHDFDLWCGRGRGGRRRLRRGRCVRAEQDGGH